MNVAWIPCHYNPPHLTISTRNMIIIGNAELGVARNVRCCKFHRGRIGKEKKRKEKNPVPLQAWSDPEGSRKLRFPDYVTTAQDGGKVVSLTHQPPLPPGNTPGTHFC